MRIPLPPPSLRELVGAVDEQSFDNPTAKSILGNYDYATSDNVLDWGCGCGRIARQLMLQHRPPRRYTGVDLHQGMVDWCKVNLTPIAPQFKFIHHNIFNPGLNPEGLRRDIQFPVEDNSVSLFIAWSVFTHVSQQSASYYLSEIARVLSETGIAVTTWFLFDKSYFPMMQHFQNALFINEMDFTNAVIFDKKWLLSELTNCGLRCETAIAPAIRGYQWTLSIARNNKNQPHVEFVEDLAPLGSSPPPVLKYSAVNRT